MFGVDAEDDGDVSSNPLHVLESHYLPYRVGCVSGIYQGINNSPPVVRQAFTILPATYPEKCPCGPHCLSSRCGMCPWDRVRSQTALFIYVNKK